MVYGKVIAGLIGWLVAGPIGLLVGVIVGHSFDRGLGITFSQASPEQLEKIRSSFFETTFTLLGYLSRADGRISQSEIDHTETIISQMGLDAAQRKRAIELFHGGAAVGFAPEQTLQAFARICGAQKQLQQTLLLFLISLALADGHQVEATEQAALERVAISMGFSTAQLTQLLRMARAQGQFHGGAGAAAGSGISLRDAYAALGVGESVSDKDLKRAYRKLMSQNHPDKLMSKGVPEDMIKLATEKSQEIQSAYEMISKTRAGKR